MSNNVNNFKFLEKTSDDLAKLSFAMGKQHIARILTAILYGLSNYKNTINRKDYPIIIFSGPIIGQILSISVIDNEFILTDDFSYINNKLKTKIDKFLSSNGYTTYKDYIINSGEFDNEYITEVLEELTDEEIENLKYEDITIIDSSSDIIGLKFEDGKLLYDCIKGIISESYSRYNMKFISKGSLYNTLIIFLYRLKEEIENSENNEINYSIDNGRRFYKIIKSDKSEGYRYHFYTKDKDDDNYTKIF